MAVEDLDKELGVVHFGLKDGHTLFNTFKIPAQLLRKQENRFDLLMFLTNVEAVFNGVAAVLGKDLMPDEIHDILRAKLASQAHMKLQEIEALFGVLIAH